jgi:putative sterol carrier protein
MAEPKLDLSASPEEVYRAIVAMPKADFEAMMDDAPQRSALIEALVEHMVALFRPDKAKDTEAVIHFKLWDRPGGGYDHHELVISDGTCTFNAVPQHDPRLTIKIRPTDLRALITGDAGATRLALRGRLRAIGDLALGLRLQELFEFPRS